MTNTNTNLLNALPVNDLINEAIRIEVEKIINELRDTSALRIRQVSSTLASFIIIIGLMIGGFFIWSVGGLLSDKVQWLWIAATCGALSYMFYYKSIHNIGASRAMAVNSSYGGFAILMNMVIWGVVPTYEEIIL
ncbi:hypothetical protein [Veillonella sp. VA137]|uniref:EamA family transporter n=1 Tax=Veillonella sp. VA137 TaxID=741828 RepID=UPI000F8EF8A1|nr:hypothetical protein [Veillonella sp. VA137]